MNRLYQYYSRPGATKRALLVTGSHIGDSSSTFAEVWQARIMNVDLLAIGFGGNELEHELKQMASDFVVTISDIGMLYALVTRALERICIGKFHIFPCFLFKCFILQPSVKHPYLLKGKYFLANYFLDFSHYHKIY